VDNKRPIDCFGQSRRSSIVEAVWHWVLTDGHDYILSENVIMRSLETWTQAAGNVLRLVGSRMNRLYYRCLNEATTKGTKCLAILGDLLLFRCGKPEILRAGKKDITSRHSIGFYLPSHIGCLLFET